MIQILSSIETPFPISFLLTKEGLVNKIIDNQFEGRITRVFNISPCLIRQCLGLMLYVEGWEIIKC